MNFARKGLVGGLTTLLVVFLFGLALDVGILHTLGNPDSVKKVLADSGIYNSVVPNALAQAQNLSTSAGDIPLNDPQIQAAAKTALTPAEIQGDANQIIDSVYAWLNDKTATPNFNIDLSSTKSAFAENVADIVQQRAASLPVCTSASEISTNAYSATCLPPGTTPAEAASQVKDQVLSGQGFLDQNINANSVKGSDSNQNIFSDQLNKLPDQYRRLKHAPYITALLAILAAAGIVLLSSTRTRGLRRVGIALAIVGIIMLVFAWGSNKLISSQVIPHINIDNAATQKEIRSVVRDLAQAIDKNYWVFGVIYTVLGALFIGSEQIMMRLVDRPAKPVPSAKHSPEILD